MLNDTLRIQTTALYTTENPKNTLRVLDNTAIFEPKTYFAGVKKVPASTLEDQLVAQNVTNVLITCPDSTFTIKLTEHGSSTSQIFEQTRQFMYNGLTSMDVYVQNASGIDINLKVVYSNDNE